MTEQQFEELLKTLALLTELKKIKWDGEASKGYSIELDGTRIRLLSIDGKGIIIYIYNSEGKIVAAIANANLPIAQGVEFFKSSIPNYIWQLIIKQNLKTEETLESLLEKLRKI